MTELGIKNKAIYDVRHIVLVEKAEIEETADLLPEEYAEETLTALNKVLYIVDKYLGVPFETRVLY